MTVVSSRTWQDALARCQKPVRSSIIRELLQLTQKQGLISFAGGLPAPECFPAQALQEASARIMARDPLAALQYGPTEGYTPLREFVRERSAQVGIHTNLNEVMITAGSQQALDLIGRLMIEPGDQVVVEDPTYLGALQAWQTLAPSYVTVPLDERGMRVDVLANMLTDGVRPRFLYLMPTFQNPTGITLAPERRYALVNLAAHYGLPIVEDDAYGELYYGDERPAPLAAIDVEVNGELSTVVHISSFSKILAPGLRLGWIMAPAMLLDKLAQVKQGLDLHTSALGQATVYEAGRSGLLEEHVPRVRDLYRVRRDAMLAALARNMPSGVTWNMPDGGMFVWLQFPAHVDATTLFHAAIANDVAFVPGSALYAMGGGHNAARLNFSLPSPAEIDEGVARLGRTLQPLL